MKHPQPALHSLTHQLDLTLEPQPEGGFTVTCPALPELITEGDTREQALHNVTDALNTLLDAYTFLQRPIPKLLSPNHQH